MKVLSALFLTLFCSVNLFAQTPKIDSLKKVIATTKVDTAKGRSLCKLCYELGQLSNYENGLTEGKKGLALCEKQKDQQGMSICLINIGIIYHLQGAYLKALEYYQKSLRIRVQIGDQKGMATCLKNIGILYNEQGNYPKALEYDQKSLQISERIGDQKGIARCLNGIGIIYMAQGNAPKALESFEKSLRISEQIGSQQDIATCLLNIGGNYQHQGNYPKALESFEKSLRISEQIGDANGIAFFSNNIGGIYVAQGNYLKALEYHQKSLRIRAEIGDTAGISISNSNLSITWSHLKNLHKAKSYAQKGLQTAQQIKHLLCLKTAAEISYMIDSALGDWKSAFEHHKLYKQYSDSLHNEDKAKEFGRIESRYQFEKEAEEAKRKEAQAKRLAEIETERRNNLQYLSIFGGIIALFGVLAFMGRFRIPARVLDIALFAALLILFEFLLILFDPILDQYTGGIPIQKLVFNSVIALGFAPLHGFLEGKLRKRLSK